MEKAASRSKLNINRKYNDVCKLTPYEERIWELHQKGMTSQEISAEMGEKNRLSINSRMKIIKENLGLVEIVPETTTSMGVSGPIYAITKDLEGTQLPMPVFKDRRNYVDYEEAMRLWKGVKPEGRED